LLLAAPGVGHLPGSLLAVAADLCLLALLRPAPRRGGKPGAHAPFQAVPILPSRGARLRGRGIGSGHVNARRTAWRYTPAAWALPAVLAALPLASAALLRLAETQGGPQVPCFKPYPASSRPFSWASLARLPLTGSAGGLPNLADFVAHRAYQESLMFGRAYGLPRQEERVYLPTLLPEAEGAGMVVTPRVLKSFSDSWLRVTLSGSPPGSLQRLLLDQGRPGEVRWCPLGELGRSLKPLARGLAATLFLLVFLLLEELGLTAAGLSGKKSVTP
jgi:hypothetical protein